MSPRGRPKMQQLELPTLENQTEELGENVMDEEYGIKHVIRGINKRNMFGMEGDVPAEVAEQAVAKYLHEGYKVLNVYMIANTPDLINLLYILVKQ